MTSGTSSLLRQLRKRRGASFVTKTACTECRKGRAKCNGQKPCARCISKEGLTCEYDVPVHVRKEDMRQEITELRRYRQLSGNILEALATGDQSDFVVHKLQQGERLEDISKELDECSHVGGSVSSAPSSQQQHGSPQSDGSDGGVQGRTKNSSLGLDETEMECFKHGSRWTELSLSDTVIEHLLLLYFCWEYPIFSGVSKRHFVKDFNTGQDRHCSSLLVNSILAVGCRFSDHVRARTDPDGSETAGVHCYAEAERLLSLCCRERSVTVVQAMGLMSSWNASCGHYSKARFYARQSIRIAIEMGLHQERGIDEMSEDTREVRSTTFWGSFMLDQAWSLTAGCLPQVSRDGILIREPAVFNRDEIREWIPYVGNQIPEGLDLRQPSNVRAVYRSLCELSTIIHNILYMMYADEDSFTSRDILNRYTQMLGWYGSLPEVLRLGKNSTPSILFVHMYYHFAMILIFHPLRKKRFVDSEISAIEICTDAAKAVVALVRSYDSLHGLRRTPCFLPYIIFASGIAHLEAADLKADPVDALSQAAQEVAILQLMSLYHGSSKRACRVLLSHALYPSSASVGQDSADDACCAWEPFVATLIWPLSDTPDRPPTPWEELRRQGLDRIK